MFFDDIFLTYVVCDAYNIELNVAYYAWQVSVEDEKDRQNRIAKMRNLLFRHEMKAKRIKKIKSKTYHRLLKKDRLKAESSKIQMDPEAAKEFALKQERLRAEVWHHPSRNKNWRNFIDEYSFLIYLLFYQLREENGVD